MLRTGKSRAAVTDSGQSCKSNGKTTKDKLLRRPREGCKKGKSTPMTEKGLRSQVEGWGRNHLQKEDQRVSGEEGV